MQNKKIFFCVLSKYDTWFRDQEAKKVGFYKSEEQFKKIGFHYTFSRNVAWISQHLSQIKQLNITIKQHQQLRKHYESQLQNLKELLKEIIKKNKKAIILAGRIGHGKSAFCKMIVNQSQKAKVISRKNIDSQTKACLLYKSSNFKHIYNEDLYIIDTPGLDAKDAGIFIVKDIDDLIMQQELSIVGIAYVIDIGQKQRNQKGKNFIFTFFQILRIKYEFKQSISFCILSKWDKNYDDDQEEVKVIYKQMQTQFKNINFLQTWERKIKWISDPSGDLTKFKRKIERDQQLKQIYERERRQLQKLLQYLYKHQKILSYEQFQHLYNEFKQIYNNKIKQELAFFNYQPQTIQCEIKIYIPAQMINHLNGFQKIQLFSQLINASSGIVLLEPRVLKPDESFLSRMILGYFFFATVGLVFWRFAKHDLQTGKLAELKNKITNQTKTFLLKMIMQTIHISLDEISFSKASYIVSVKCFDYQDSTISVQVIQTNKRYKVKPLGRNRYHRFIFSCKCPTVDSYSKFLEKISKQFYNS